jgi:hypothetical protein
MMYYASQYNKDFSRSSDKLEKIRISNPESWLVGICLMAPSQLPAAPGWLVGWSPVRGKNKVFYRQVKQFLKKEVSVTEQ